VIGNDGAMYFLTGGRRAQSELYRVSYVGNEPCEPVNAPEVGDLVKLRRQLEAVHVTSKPENLELIWSPCCAGAFAFGSMAAEGFR